MTIRTKTLLVLGITLAVLVVVLYLVLSSLLGRGFGAIETRSAERDMARLRETLANETEGLCQKANDWAAWDDAYRFAEDHNPEFVAANIAPTTFDGMRLGFILIFDGRGRLILGTGFDAAAGVVKEPPGRLLAEHFGVASPWITHKNEGSVHSGLLFTAGLPPAAFCSQPILTTEGHGPIRGALVFGRYFEGEARQLLGRMTRLDLAFAVEGEPDFSDELSAALARLASPDAVYVLRASEKEIVGFTRFQDAYGKRSLVARAMMPREVHAEAKKTLLFVLIALVLVGLAFALAMMAVMERVVLGRLAALSAGVAEITDKYDFSSRVPALGEDEIGGLGRAVNSLLAAAEQVAYSGGESEAKYTALQRHLPVALAQLEVLLDEGGKARDLVLTEMTDAFAAAAGLRTEALGRSLIASLALSGESAIAWLTAADGARSQPGPLSFELRVGAQRPRVRITVVSISDRCIMANLATLTNGDKSARPSE